MHRPRLNVPRRRRRLLVASLALSLLAAAGSFQLLSGTRLGHELELRTIDARFAERGPRPAPRDVLILGIDNNTDRAVGVRYPYPRGLWADAVRKLTAAGASAIVFDVQFLERTTSAADDAALVEAIRESGRVVLATGPESDATHQGSRAELPLPMRGFRRVADEDPLARSGALVGTTRPIQSSDGVARWIDTTGRWQVQGSPVVRDVPALAVAAIALDEHRDPRDVTRGAPRRLQLDYYGPASSQPRTGGFAVRNVAEVFATDDPADLTWAAGKIVLVGATGAVFQDLHEVPFAATHARGATAAARSMPGIELHATALANLRDHSWLRDERHRVAIATALALALLSWVLLLALPLPVGLAAAAALDLAVVARAVRAFDHQVVVDLAAPLGAGLAAQLAIVLALTVAALRERRRVAGLFARYVSADVVRELIDHRDDISLEGERREVTVLFADLRGFTTMSEHADPADTVAQLNHYFEAMLEAIEVERGTLDKFIGDGLMAFFGAPLPQGDHAARAIRAATGMLQRLGAVNDERRADGLEPLEVGIGIHTGEAIIGNIGAPAFRVDFTAIGDTVNLASRIEGLTREAGAAVLASATTVAAAGTGFQLTSCGHMRVKGRAAAVEVFRLDGDSVGNGLPPVSSTLDDAEPASIEGAA